MHESATPTSSPTKNFWMKPWRDEDRVCVQVRVHIHTNTHTRVSVCVCVNRKVLLDSTSGHNSRSRLDRSVELLVLYKCCNSVPVG